MKKLNYDEIFAFIVPTGIGASIGGYAGDASYYAQKISSIKPTIVNANVVNAACFSGITDNMLYAEGWGIDEFFKGNLQFSLPTDKNKGNKIGIIFDKAIPQDVLNVHINTINAVKTVYGIDIIGYEITSDEVGVTCNIDKTGASAGCVNNPETMLIAGKKLLKKGADVLAVVCLFPDEENIQEEKNYANGCGVDIVGGIESIISHYISKNLFVPCVHAPAFKNYQISSEIVDKRVAAEYITPTFLPCLLLGLKKAPLYKKINSEKIKDKIDISNVKALIMPASSLGSSAVLSAIEKNISIYAVKENKTVLNVKGDEIFQKCCIIEIDTYEDLYKKLERKYGK